MSQHPAIELQDLKNREHQPETVKVYHQKIMDSLRQKSAEIRHQQEEPLPQLQLKDDQVSKTEAAVILTVNSASGRKEVKGVANTALVDVVNISGCEESFDSPVVLSLFGYKINLNDKIKAYMDNYMKNYALTRSHNLLMSKLSEFKVSYLGYILSMLGVTQEEIRKLQKKAITKTIEENKSLFEENEYNHELINIIGGSKKQVKSQVRIIGELRKQLTTQAERLGMKNYYSKQKLAEIQKDQCQKILSNFLDEKAYLDYQREYLEQMEEKHD